MRFFCVLLRYILLVVLCLWLVALPCLSSDVFLCLSGENQPRLRRRNESFSNRAVADVAQARAYLSPSVLLGTLRSVLVQRDGTVRAWFAIDTILKMPPSNNDTGEDSVVIRRRNTRASSSAMSSNNDTGEEDSVVARRRRRTRASSAAMSSNYTRLYAMSSNNDTSGEDSVAVRRRSTRASMSSNYTRLHARRDYVSVPAVRPRNWSSSLARDAYLAGTPSWTVVHNRHPPDLAGGAFRRITRTLSKRPEDTEVVYYSSGRCVLEVNQDNLRLGSQYVVFGGVPSERHSWPSLTASALPIPNDKRILRAVKKVLCKGCAKPPSIEGLQNVKVEEGSKARLRCHLAGNPIPWVEWFKDGKKITTRGRIRVKTKRRTSRLVIRRVRVSDRGVYECRAGNIVQKEPVSATASLVVTRKRRKPTTQPATTTAASTSTSTQSSPWTTEPCRVTDFCNNGGTCVFYKDVQEYVCHCAEGYVGLRCDYKDVRVSVGEVKNYRSRGAIP